MPRELRLLDQSGGDRDRAHAVGLGGANVVGMIADKRDWTRAIDPSFAARVAQRDTHQVRAIMGHFGKRSEAQVAAEPGALHLGPADASEVTGDEGRRNSAPPELIE